MASQSERRAETRARILAAMRRALLAHGFEAISLDTVLSAEGLSKGAFYYHFRNKEAAFAAIYEEVARETIALARPHGGRDDAVATLIDATLAWLQAMEAPTPRAILLDQGPRVLGWARARAIEDPIALASMEALVKATSCAMKIDATLTARMINAALTELALLRYASNGQSPSKKAMRHAVTGIVHGLLLE